MVSKQKKRILRLSLGLLSAVTIASVSTMVHAAPSAEELDGKTSELQEELNLLTDEFSSLSAELDKTSSQIKTLAEEIEKNKLDLAAARLNERAQYDAMKDRIKFMYEEGNLSLLNILFTSKSMGDFLNKSEYVTTISEYDRNMLDEFQEILTDIEEKQKALTKKQKKLASLSDELTEKQEALISKISSASGELDDYDAQLKRAKAAEKALETAQNNEISGSVGGVSQSGSSVAADTSDVALLAAILECEAGQSYDGMLAVGTVIMNRVASAKFPNSISGVVYQPNQFSPAGNGALNTVLAKGPSASACSAAQAVLGGARYSAVADCYFFYADWYAKQQNVSGINVGGNVFFK